jgi:hypothetical protein
MLTKKESRLVDLVKIKLRLYLLCLQILLQSIVHTAKMPDKNIWASLMQALNYWFKIPNEKFEAINNIIKLWRVTNYVYDDCNK